MDILTNILRFGTLTSDDLKLINDTAYPPNNPLPLPGKDDTHVNPFITESNVFRKSYNDACIKKHANETSSDIHYIPAIVKTTKSSLSLSEQKSLFGLSDDRTGRKFLMLKVFVGMPCMITQNHKNPAIRQSNGSLGHIHSIQLNDAAPPPVVKVKANGRQRQFYHQQMPDMICVKLDGVDEIVIEGYPPVPFLYWCISRRAPK